MNKQSGFTLIELVIVVVIMGFLAVSAIPKFLNITEQAKQANITGMAGGYATAVSLVRAQWEAEGRPSDGTSNIVDYDGTNLFLTLKGANIQPGYVTGLAATGSDLGGGFSQTNCLDIWQNIFQQPPSVSVTVSDNTNYFVSQSGTNETSICHYYLKETLNRVNDVFVAPTAGDTGVGNSFTYQPANSAVVVYINAQ